MSIQDLGSSGELIAALATVATLIYLALQIKNNARETRLGSIVSINHLINEAWEPIYNNDRNVRIWVTGSASPDQLDEEDLTIFSLFMARLVNVLLTACYQNRSRTLEHEEFAKYIGTLNAILQTPGGTKWFNELGGSDLIPQEVVEQLKESNVQRWSIPTQDE